MRGRMLSRYIMLYLMLYILLYLIFRDGCRPHYPFSKALMMGIYFPCFLTLSLYSFPPS
jgi:hypothetical protein